MPNQVHKDSSSKATPSPHAPAAHALPACYQTPDKKTKSINYSPAKKPITGDLVTAAGHKITITPFNLMMELES